MERCLTKYIGLGTACRYEISFRVSKVGELFTRRILMCRVLISNCVAGSGQGWIHKAHVSAMMEKRSCSGYAEKAKGSEKAKMKQ
ncbi:MAG: hypothetical protein IPF54_26945 [Draconibacterium sp.]|nr:hypothetical protein [Draconibacterium sp.]